jgi:hypothetical protein
MRSVGRIDAVFTTISYGQVLERAGVIEEAVQWLVMRPEPITLKAVVVAKESPGQSHTRRHAGICARGRPVQSVRDAGRSCRKTLKSVWMRTFDIRK